LLFALVNQLHHKHANRRQIHQLATHLLSQLSPLSNLPALQLTKDWNDEQIAHGLHVLSCQVGLISNSA
jgi:hypothetical protein